MSNHTQKVFFPIVKIIYLEFFFLNKGYLLWQPSTYEAQSRAGGAPSKSTSVVFPPTGAQVIFHTNLILICCLKDVIY